MMLRRVVLVSGIGLLAGQAAGNYVLSAAPNVPEYTVRVIEEPAGHVWSASGVEALNNRGEMVLWTVLKDHTQRAFHWRDGKLTNLGGLGGDSTIPHGMNDHGQVVGSATTAQGETCAFLWSERKLQKLSSEPKMHSEAGDINNAGTIVGNLEEPGSRTTHAVYWSHGQLHRLPDLGKSSSAGSVNDAGVIAGQGQGPNGGNWHGFIWTGDQVRDLGDAPGYESSVLSRINPGGVGAGYFLHDLGPHSKTTTQAFLYRDGKITDAPVLEKAHIIPFDLNAAGDMACGTGTAPYNAGITYLFHSGQLFPLNDLVRGSGWEIEAAPHINDRGQIAGIGKRNGERRTLLLSPKR